MHDYASTVHPWLMGLCDDIQFAVGDEARLLAGRDEQARTPLPTNTTLMVFYAYPNLITVYEEHE